MTALEKEIRALVAEAVRDELAKLKPANDSSAGLHARHYNGGIQ